MQATSGTYPLITRRSASTTISSNVLKRPRLTLLPTSTFICTICWAPKAYPEKPKVLGASARIACYQCWRAVLDLSICWMCGECVVRGDEAVSLGWCFWHWGCFGCLVCGGRMRVPEFGLDGPEGGKGSRGVELDKIPLCGVCESELEGESQGKLLGRGLETVSKFDGGLSRNRLKVLSKEGRSFKTAPKDLFKVLKTPNDAIGTEAGRGSPRDSGSHRLIDCVLTDDRSSLIDDAAGIGISEEVSEDESQNCSDTDIADFGRSKNQGTTSTAYVSVFDPIGEPAFEPSRTKPLPKWMQLLPSNVQKEREQPQRNGTIKAAEHSSTINTTSSASITTPFSVSEARKIDTQSPCLEDSLHLSQRSRPKSPTQSSNIAADGRKFRGKIPFTPSEAEKLEPKRPSERVDRKSQTMDSVYVAPPQSPYTAPLGQNPSRRPDIQRKFSSHSSQSGSSTSISITVKSSTCCGSEGRTTLPVVSPPDFPPMVDGPRLSLSSRTPFVVQSSEYLERYQPRLVTPTHQKYVAKHREPILDKIKKQNGGRRRNKSQSSEAKRGSCGDRDEAPKFGNVDYGVDPTRECLKKELRNLFRED